MKIELARQLALLAKIRPDKQIIVGCNDQKVMLDFLKSNVSDLFGFELVENYGVKIYLKD